MIIFTDHSLLKLRQRNIPKKLVIETVNNPDCEGRGHSERKACFKKFGKLFLKVVYKNEGGDIVIITQHWVAKINN